MYWCVGAYVCEYGDGVGKKLKKTIEKKSMCVRVCVCVCVMEKKKA